MSQYEIDYLHDKEQIELALVISLSGSHYQVLLKQRIKEKKGQSDLE
jgi:hypothetical protein